jgi:hypothetical protein
MGELVVRVRKEYVRAQTLRFMGILGTIALILCGMGIYFAATGCPIGTQLSLCFAVILGFGTLLVHGLDFIRAGNPEWIFDQGCIVLDGSKLHIDHQGEIPISAIRSVTYVPCKLIVRRKDKFKPIVFERDYLDPKEMRPFVEEVNRRLQEEQATAELSSSAVSTASRTALVAASSSRWTTGDGARMTIPIPKPTPTRRNEAMSEQEKPMVKCKKCAAVYSPEMSGKGPWVCPQCQKENPNLKRLYRSVADLYILGLIATGVILALLLPEQGLDLSTGLQAAQGALLLVAIVIIYRSRVPWTDGVAKAFVWIPLLVAAFLNVALPLLLGAPVAIGYLVVYPIIFIYLLQLSYHARKCAVRPPRRG